MCARERERERIKCIVYDTIVFNCGYPPHLTSLLHISSFLSLVTVIFVSSAAKRRFLLPAHPPLSLFLFTPPPSLIINTTILSPSTTHSQTNHHQNSNYISKQHKIMFISSSQVPSWLQVLLTEKFYNACIIHEEAKKNEKNVYCLHCCISLCPHCLSPHRSHRLLQIRRYVYHDVIRLDDAAKLIDCTAVQSYTTNSAKVVFLNQRPQTKNFRGSGNFCSTCDRSLQDPYRFCSLSCKISDVIRTTGSLSGYLFECNYLPFSDEGLMTPDTVLEPAGSNRTSSASGGYEGVVDCRTTLVCTAATTEVVRKKRTSGGATTYRPPCRPACSPVSETSANRRKGNPQRAPLY